MTKKVTVTAIRAIATWGSCRNSACQEEGDEGDEEEEEEEEEEDEEGWDAYTRHVMGFREVLGGVIYLVTNKEQVS